MLYYLGTSELLQVAGEKGGGSRGRGKKLISGLTLRVEAPYFGEVSLTNLLPFQHLIVLVVYVTNL